MVETDIDKFALNFNDKHFSLKVSIFNNQQILLELTDKDTNKLYYNVTNVEQLKTVTTAFNSVLTIRDAYNIIRSTIEAGKIMLGESDNGGAVELEFHITLPTGTYPPFSILLYLSQDNVGGLQVQTLPPGVAKNTTEVNSVVQSNVQAPMQLEYIQPILQVHYPDGSVKNTHLQPRLEGLNQNISEQQLQQIQKSLALQGIQQKQQGNLDEISERQLKLAKMASIQNQQNPNVQNMNSVTLMAQGNQKLPNLNYDEQSILSRASRLSKIQGEEEGLDIEDLYMTEEGKVIFRNGLLRGIIHKYAEIDDVVTKIQDIFLKGVRFNLVYKAFDLDDKARTFHEKCDKIETSLVLIETDKDVRFGGFTTKSWRGNNVKKVDNYSFVFNLDTNKIFEIIPNQPAIGCYPNYGPVFFGCQIRIYDEFFKNGGTTCHKGLNFKTTKDYELNNGVKNFLIKDIEVYSLENMDID